MKILRRLFFRLFTRHRRLELCRFNYTKADQLLRENFGKVETAQWHIAPEEYYNHVPGVVWLERRQRIVE